VRKQSKNNKSHYLIRQPNKFLSLGLVGATYVKKLKNVRRSRELYLLIIW